MTQSKDVYASMAPATYTRTLGSGVGRSRTTIEPVRRTPALTTAMRRVRRRRHVGAKGLLEARARLETKLDPEVLEIFAAARAETKVRHVRSAAGVRRYHAPIGTPIIGGRAVLRVPAGGSRGSGGGSLRKPRSTSPLGKRNPLTGSRGGRGPVGGLRQARSKVRRAVPGNGGGFNGGGVPGGGGFGGLVGGGLFGGAIGKLFGGGKKPPKGKKPKKAKQPPKAKAPKKTRSGTGSGSGSGNGSTTKPKSSTTPKTPSQDTLDQAAQQLLLVPPDRLSGVLHTLPYDALAGVLRTIQDPEFPSRVGASPAAAKGLADAAARLTSKSDEPHVERCMGCGDELDGEAKSLPSGAGYELVVCADCASETKAGDKDSGIPGHLPDQLRRYWTTGKGKARWAANPHPYTALVDGLRSEGVPAKVIHGLAANLFRDVFGIYPAQRPRALGGSTHGYAR